MEEDNLVPPFFTRDEARIRLLVLAFSLKIEGLVSHFLGQILNIDKPSKSLGNTSSSLSLNQKVNLLLDTKYFTKEDSKTMLVFMEIRNQFMHNEEAKSFKDCLRFLDGRNNYLINKYPNDKVGEEEILEQCWNDLTGDVITSIKKVMERVKERGPKRLGDNIIVHFKHPPKE